MEAEFRKTDMRRNFPLNEKTEAKKSPQIRSDSAAGLARPATRIDQAVAEFDQDEIIEMLMKNARILTTAHDHRLALNLLRNILIRRADHPEALALMGTCLRETGRYEEALKCFRALVKTNRRQDGQVLLAETYYMTERDEMSLAAYREVLKGVVEDRSKLFEIYKNIGNIHVRAGDFEAAEEYYDKAYTINPNSDVLMVNYGTLEIQREAVADAVARFRRAVEINPDNDKAWVGLALVHRQMGDHELAWANVERALDINRRNRTAIRLVVDWGLIDQRFNYAIEKLQEYLEVDGEDAEMSFTLVKIFTHIGRFAEARLELERVLALDPAIQGADNLRLLLDRELEKISAVKPEAGREL